MEEVTTKKVRVTLSALTRVEYSEVLEVPADMTDAELNALVDQRYDEVDAGLYCDDPEYWERGSSCGFTAVESRCEAEMIVKRNGGDTFILTCMQPPAAS